MLSDGGRRTLPTLDVLLACALRGDSEATPSTPRSDAARLAAARASHAAASERAASELVLRWGCRLSLALQSSGHQAC